MPLTFRCPLSFHRDIATNSDDASDLVIGEPCRGLAGLADDHVWTCSVHDSPRGSEGALDGEDHLHIQPY